MAVPSQKTPIYGLQLDSDASGNAFALYDALRVTVIEHPEVDDEYSLATVGYVNNATTGTFARIDAANITSPAVFRAGIGLGEASVRDVGTNTGNVVEVNSNGTIDPTLIPPQDTNNALINLFLTQYL